MRIKKGIAFKLSISIITVVILIFLVILSYNYHLSKLAIMREIEAYSEAQTKAVSNAISWKILPVVQAADVVAKELEFSNLSDTQIKDLIRTTVLANDEIYGLVTAFQPYMFKKNTEYYDPYFYERDGDFNYNNTEGYITAEWYKTALDNPSGIWSEPYIDENGIGVITYSIPFYKTVDGIRTISGVVACDLDINWLIKYLDNIRVLNTGVPMLFSKSGACIYSTNKNHLLQTNIFDIDARLKIPKLKEIGTKIIKRESGFEKFYFANKKYYISFIPLEMPEWTIALVIPADELLKNLNDVTYRLFFLGISGYIAVFLSIIYLARKITSPLKILADTAEKIGSGEFNNQLPSIKSKDEIGVLSSAFTKMQCNLVNYIDDLRITTAAKEKIENELHIAKSIQQSFLPSDFKICGDIDLDATQIPAKEVGGDMYDFFMSDSEHFCFAIGDVSGKGVPAALFMAVTKTLLRSKIHLMQSPADVLNSMNKDLSKDNETFTFVTFFLGSLNIKTGELLYCNAGHNFPIISTNGNLRLLKNIQPSPPLGIADIRYSNDSLFIRKGDALLLYTDGVTEAKSRNNSIYSEKSLMSKLISIRRENASAVVKCIVADVEEHSTGCEQSDDITLLFFEYGV